MITAADTGQPIDVDLDTLRSLKKAPEGHALVITVGKVVIATAEPFEEALKHYHQLIEESRKVNE